MNFKIGQKVVKYRVFDKPNDPRNLMAVSVPIGTIVTIRDIDSRGHKYGHPDRTLRFEEILNPSVPTTEGQWELGYSEHCFRPLVEKNTETGMGILREILDRETVSDKPPVRQPVRG